MREQKTALIPNKKMMWGRRVDDIELRRSDSSDTEIDEQTTYNDHYVFNCGLWGSRQ